MSVAAVQRRSWPRRGHVLMSPALTSRGLVAGFTTRALGSMGGSATPPEEAARARALLAQRLGFASVVRVKQVHGNRVMYAPFDGGPAGAGEAGPGRTKAPEADAMWTDRPGLLLGVVAGDCVPVLVADGNRLGAAHAGWEGTTRGVSRRLVDALREAGADPAQLVAALGPSVGPCCYTVTPERAATIRDRLGPAAERALVRTDDGIAFDLWTANAEQLAVAGVPTVEVAGTCTRCGGEDLFSRRGGEVGLLGLAFIGRPDPARR